MNILWLCDIDGTLVNITQVHLNTYKKLYKEIAGIEVTDEILLPTFGMSEHEMHPAVFKALRIKKDEKLIKKMLAAHPKYFRTQLSANNIEPLSGVNEFLHKLKKRGEHCGIVTGNLKQNAELILQKAKLLSYFDFIATDDGTKVRWEIVRDAIEIARKKGYVWNKVVVIGDTMSDIEAAWRCAKETGEIIIAVAVATGTCTFAELKDADLRLNGFDKKSVLLLKKIMSNKVSHNLHTTCVSNDVTYELPAPPLRKEEKN